MNGSIYNFIIILVLTFDMGGELGVRFAAFILIFIGFAFSLYSRKALVMPLSISKELFFLVFLLVLWPFILLIKSHVNGYDLSLSISQISSLFFAFTYFLYRIQTYKINGLKNLLYSFYVLSCFYCAMIVIYFFNADLFGAITGYFMEQGLYAGVRSESVDLPNVYIKSSLFIFFAFSCFLGKNRIKSSIIYVGTFITTSKILFLFNTLLVFYRLNFRVKLFLILILILSFPFLSSFLSSDVLNFSEYLLTAVDGNSITASKRISDFYSVLNLFNKDYIGLLFGFGPGSLIFTDFMNTAVVNIELDHLNTIRKFGLLWFILLCSYIFYVGLLLKKNGMSSELIGLIGVFVLAGTNPVLISPMFFIILTECRLSALK